MISSTRCTIVIYQGNSQTINIQGLYDNVSASYLDAATLTATLVDDQGNSIVGCTNVTLSYVPGSNGDYRGTFGDASFYPPVGTGYTLIVDGSQGAAAVHLELTAAVRARNS